MLKLQKEWEEYLSSVAKINKLHIKNRKLYTKDPQPQLSSCSLNAESHRYYAKARKAYAEEEGLRAEAVIKWLDSVIKKYGKDASVVWIGNIHCEVNDDVYN